MSFIEKYNPKKYEDIIGNNKKYIELEKNILKNNKNKYLIIGKNNLGKTTFIKIFSKKNNYKLINVNINQIDKIDKNIFSYNFFMKKIILIDNIRFTNISYNEKTKLIKNINNLINILNNVNNILIVIISDKNIKEFKKIKNININNFKKYKKDTLKKHIKKVFDNEKIKYSSETYDNIFEELIEKSNENINKIYLNIEAYMLNNKKTIRYNEKTRNNIKKSENDTCINDTFELLNSTFKKFDINNIEELNKKENLYYNEPFIVNSNIRENYIKLSNYKHKNNIDIINNIADSLSNGDIINKKMEHKKDYSLLKYCNYFNSIIPLYYLNGKYNMFFNFPSNINKDNKIINNNKKMSTIKKQNDKYYNLNLYEINYINNYIK